MSEKINRISPGLYKFAFWLDKRKIEVTDPQTKNRILREEWTYVSPVYLFNGNLTNKIHQLIELSRGEVYSLSPIALAFFGLCRMTKGKLTFEKSISTKGKGVTKDHFQEALQLGAKLLKPEDEWS
ncbi:MAG: hypothetical protein HYW86_03310 [Candidatus Roizmanbacteria bacterium]|nr:MAG: hypothetical protein HYW86_03310 [Candidatus Roizmanbacteria bacterium]